MDVQTAEQHDPQQVPAEMLQPIQSDRAPADVETFKQTEEYCLKLLAAVPELGGVAVIPLWNNTPENFPNGLLRLRSPQTPPMPALLKLLGKLTSFSVDVNRDLFMQIRGIDNYAGELAEKIKEYTDRLNTLQENQSANRNEQKSG